MIHLPYVSQRQLKKGKRRIVASQKRARKQLTKQWRKMYRRLRRTKRVITLPRVFGLLFGLLVIAGIAGVGFLQYQQAGYSQGERSHLLAEIGQLQTTAVWQEAQQEEERLQWGQVIAVLREEIEALKARKPQTIIQEVAVPKEDELPQIVEQWQAVVAHVSCDFHFKESAAWGKRYRTQQGSGIVEEGRFAGEFSNMTVLTNKHVALADSKFVPKQCTITLPGQESFVADNSSIDIVHMSGDNYDWALIEIKNPPRAVVEQVYKVKTCTGVPAIGERIVILGYPAIGAEGNITATEGIIAGYDGEYYVTSAKVERGNSGGAAILLKENCYLGIPTFVQKGEIESLARILTIGAVLK